jgi:hypothetical protein
MAPGFCVGQAQKSNFCATAWEGWTKISRAAAESHGCAPEKITGYYYRFCMLLIAGPQ